MRFPDPEASPKPAPPDNALSADPPRTVWRRSRYADMPSMGVPAARRDADANVLDDEEGKAVTRGSEDLVRGAGDGSVEWFWFWFEAWLGVFDCDCEEEEYD